MTQTFFTADHHFNHFNIIKYCKRPWATAEEMNEELIRRWNLVVGSEDTTIHLGDFCMGPPEVISKFRRRLNGKIILIRGNHDRSNSVMLKSGFDDSRSAWVTDFEGKKLLLKHHPSIDKNDWLGAEAQFCGHVHGNFVRNGNIYNVGVDVRNFQPVTAREIFDAKNK